jgi:hypothetical protein
MKKLIDLLNLKRRATDGEWGVEIEVEGKHLPDDVDGWTREVDGSLKAAEAAEYVMPRPLNMAGVNDALDTLNNAFKDNKSVIDESIRAGVHVHMNVQQWTSLQMFTFATVYFIVEDLLVKWCGENREGNLFCLRSSDAENILFLLHKTVDERNLKYLNDEDFRYCSLNFCSLSKYGSLEFRSMRSTPNLDLIRTWVAMLAELRDNALKFKDPEEVVVSMSGEGEDFFLKRIFPSFHDELAYNDYKRTIREAARRIQMLAFTIDWRGLDKPVKNPFAEQVTI